MRTVLLLLVSAMFLVVACEEKTAPVVEEKSETTEAPEADVAVVKADAKAEPKEEAKEKAPDKKAEEPKKAPKAQNKAADAKSKTK